MSVGVDASASAPTSKSPWQSAILHARVQLVAAVLRGGFTPERAGKIAGHNDMPEHSSCD
jgi:hypothetical protein